MPHDTSNYDTILIELTRAVKMHNLYPVGHPQFDAAMEKAYLLFKKEVDEGEIKFKIDQRGFYMDRTPVAPGNRDVALLARKLFFRRINELAFTRRMTINDLNVLLSVAKEESEEVQEKGGVETIFAARDVAGILVNSLNYEDLKNIKKQLEEKKLEEKRIEAEDLKEAEESGEARTAREGEPEQAPPLKDEPLGELLARIRTETDFLRYNDLSVRIKEKTDLLLMEKNFDDAFPAALVFHNHMAPSSGLSVEIRKTASDRLTDLLTRDMLENLVYRAGARDEKFRKDVQLMLVYAGEEAARLLLTAIIEAPEALTRKSLFNALVQFGPMIREQVEARVESPEWYVVRQMVSLLGELGDPRSLDVIENAYRHNDIRVKREVLKSLMKLPSPRSTKMLLQALDENDQSLVTQAIISLGVLKDPSVIDVLGSIALKREAFADLMEPKKEAIKALGVIGDRKAVPYLMQILSKRVWFGRRVNEEARALAAYSLGLIGGAEAFEAIEQTLEDSEGELYAACKRVLDGREKAYERQ